MLSNQLLLAWIEDKLLQLYAHVAVNKHDMTFREGGAISFQLDYLSTQRMGNLAVMAVINIIINVHANIIKRQWPWARRYFATFRARATKFS